ncbi:membrane protein [Ornithinimicrobium pekingense]|uniref:Membrane protein n=1 Tax=Ornithinimicrobium pekingense TaxID=384677 RepID=A0ABQ2F9E7_9MICO|nr:membrane protein [Ornithinimicrobium pekingense]
MPWVVPSWADPVVARATGVLGGPLGRYAVVGARGLAGVAAVLVALGAAVLALGVWQKGHCLMKGWSTPDQFWRACYSDLPVVHVSSALADRQLPWAGGVPSTQPPLSGLAMWLLARVSPEAGSGTGAQQWVLVLWALACVLLLAAGVLAVVALRPRRPWQAAHLAASPVLVTLALVSTDLLGVSLTLLALWAWRRGHGWGAGVLLGLASLVRPFPLLVLLAIVLVAARRGRDDGPSHDDMAGRHLDPPAAPLRAGQAVVGAVLGALAVVVPLLLLEPRSLTAVTQWWGSGTAAGYGALQMVPDLMGSPLLPLTSTVVAVVGWLAAAGLGVWLVGRPGRRLGEAQLAAAMTAVVVLTAPSLSVQSGLWVLVFLALSARPWGEHLVWALVETLHFVATWLHIAFASDPGRGLPPETYALVVTLRAAAWVWVLWRVWDEADPGAPPRARPAASRPADALALEQG